MRYFLLLFVLTLSMDMGFSQTYQFLGSKVYGGSSGDASSQILKIREDRLLLIGESNSSAGGNKVTVNCNPGSSTNDIWLVMVDTAFSIIWQSEIGGSLNERKANVIQTGNGNLLMSFMSTSDSSCSKGGHLKGSEDIMIVMMDSIGNLLWERNFGTVLDCYGCNLYKLSDGNFLLATSTRAGVGFDKTSNSKGGYDFWLIKFDSFGSVIFDKSYGGSLNEIPYMVDGHLGLKIIELQNNELALFANTMSSNSLDVSDTCFGGPDYWMIKIDSLGTKLSDYCFGGMLAENFCDVVKTNNGFILVGTTLSPQSGLVSQPQTIASAWNAWIIAVDTLGNKIWDRRYQGGAIAGSGVQREAALQILPASNNEYWITGTTNNPAGYDVTDSAYGAIDAWMFKIDGVGNIIWNKRFGSPSTTRNGSSVLMSDSSIFLLCTGDTGISDVKPEFGYGQTDYYLVHFRYASIISGLESQEFLSSAVSIYPNPALEVLNIKFNSDLKIKSLFIISLDGKVVYTYSNPDSSVDISSLSPSIYFLKLNTEKGDIYKRFCKQ